MRMSKTVVALGALLFGFGCSSVLAGGATDECPTFLNHTFNRLQTGKPESLCQYRGKVVLIVNSASFCCYTHQYEGLEALYRKYKDRGLVVVGFPSNDFGGQEPGKNHEIAEFCRLTYGVEFPMFGKSSVTSIRTKPLCAELLAHRSITAVEFSQIPRRSRRLSRDELRQPCRARRSGADRASRKTIGREASRLEGLRLRRGGAMRVSARIGEARRAAEAALDALKAALINLEQTRYADPRPRASRGLSDHSWLHQSKMSTVSF